jgi:hypothetical protein
MIINTGNREMESQCIMSPRAAVSGLQGGMAAVKGGLTLRRDAGMKKPPGTSPGGSGLNEAATCGFEAYQVVPEILPPIEVNFVTMALLMKGIAAIKQTAIAEAMRPYSIAVAPDSSFTKRTSLFI